MIPTSFHDHLSCSLSKISQNFEPFKPAELRQHPSTSVMTTNQFGMVSVVSLSPWTYFDNVWTAVLGYPAEDFKFIPGETPLSTLKESLLLNIAYLVIIFGGREFMRGRPPLQLNTLFKFHNFALTAVSGVLLILFAEQLLPQLWRHGLYENICGPSGWSQKLVVLYYLNYVTKYIELLDTFFLMVKKKPLSMSQKSTEDLR